MTTNWNSMREMSLSALIVRLGLVGALAGLVAWLTVLSLHLLSEGSRPSWVALLLAIPRGAVVGMILALVLHAYWKHHPGTGKMKGQ
jgi:putative flippase GtrA